MSSSPLTQPAVGLAVKHLPDSWTFPGVPGVSGARQTVHLYVLLDVTRAELTTMEHRRDEPYDLLPGDHHTWPKVPGERGNASFQYLSMPRRMSWLTRLQTPTEVNALLDRLAPLAETIVREALPIPGTDDLDWTEEAVRAADVMQFLAEYPDGLPVLAGKETVDEQIADRHSRRLYVEAARLFEVRPDLISPHWARLGDAKLNSAAEYNLRFLISSWHPEVREQLGVPLGDDGDRRHVEVVGMRAWMYRYRQEHAGELRVHDAIEWYARPERRGRITADLSDEQLTALVVADEGDAEDQGLLLVGAEHRVRQLRDDEREAVRAELRTAAERYVGAKAAHDVAQRHRAAVLARVIAWGIEKDSDTVLAEQAKMSRPGVAKFRARLLDPEETGAGVEQEADR